MSNSGTRNSNTVGGSYNSSQYPVQSSSTHTIWQYSNQYPGQVSSHQTIIGSPFYPYMSVFGTCGIPGPSVTETWVSMHSDPTPPSTFYPSASVPRIQDQSLGVTVVGCTNFKDDYGVRPWQHFYVVLKYGGRKYKKEGSDPTTNENFVIQLIEGVREMDIYVSKNNSESFIGTGKIELHKVLAQGFDNTVWPLKSNATSGRQTGEVYVHLTTHYSDPNLYNSPPKFMDDSPGKLYNASPKIINDSPGKVEESKRKKGSLHPTNGDVRSRINREVMEKLNDVKISEVMNTASFQSTHYSDPNLYNSPPKFMDDSPGKLYNASPKIINDSPSKVEESKRKKGSLHPSNGDVRSRINREVMEKLNDVKISEVKNTASFQSSEGFLGELEKNTPKRFSHEELKKFTSGFSDKVGSGGFGNVYGGQLHGAQVAVKVLVENHLIEESFKAEVSAMFKTSHRNLVKCYGYCYDHKMKALVYEYMENGSLNAILYGNPRKVEWAKFYQIAIETAKGLSYLHDSCDHQIIHHDLKPANVLLDANLSAKITDFGLARLIDKDVSHVSRSNSNCRGTVGYMAPEVYMPFSEITSKCDVFSFGIMLFEILAMRRTSEISKWSPKQVWLKFDSGDVDEIMEEFGIKEKDKDNAILLSVVALWCAQHTPQARPPMSTVVNMLEGKIQVKKPPNPSLPAPQQFYWEVSPSPSIHKSYNY